MATVTYTFPDAFAKQLESAGLLDSERAEAVLRAEIRAAAVRGLQDWWAKIESDPIPPMSDEEIQAEIDAYRAEQRRAAGN